MTPTAGKTEETFVLTTKRGIDLGSFEDVSLQKKVPKVPPVSSLEEAASRLGNDNKKLLAIISEGLQAEAVRQARDDNSGWIELSEDGKETPFEGSLANSEDVNPVVLMFAKLSFGFDEIDSKDPKSADKKRAAKEAAKAQIRLMPTVLDSLRKKAEKSQKAE